jgi:hypothetical protein
MTTHTWIEIVGGFALGLIALFSFFMMRAMLKTMPSQLTRRTRTRTLIVFVGHLLIWTMIGVSFFSGLISVFYFAAIAAVYIPMIIWVLKSPIDDHVA